MTLVKSIYVAAALSESRFANGIAEELREQGHVVVSNWHAGAPNKKEPPDVEVKRALWFRCKRELREATHLVLYAMTGIPRATFVELGYFLALCEESCELGCVYWIAPDASECPIPIGDSRVMWCESVSKFLEIVKR